MRLLGDGSQGTGEHIQTFRCQACRTTFSARRNTPLYRLKTPASRVGEVLTALCEGLDVAAAGRIFGYHPSTITAWLTRAGEQRARLHQRALQHLTLAHIQLDELRTRLRCRTRVLWLWLAIDPLSKIIPVLVLGPRTQNAAHTVIHTLRQQIVPTCLPVFTSDGLNLSFYAALSPFRGVGGGKGTTGTPLAGGNRADLWSGQEGLSASSTGARDPADPYPQTLLAYFNCVATERTEEESKQEDQHQGCYTHERDKEIVHTIG